MLSGKALDWLYSRLVHPLSTSTEGGSFVFFFLFPCPPLVSTPPFGRSLSLANHRCKV